MQPSAGEACSHIVSRERGANNQSAREAEPSACSERRRAIWPGRKRRERRRQSVKHVRQSHQRAAERRQATQPRFEGRETLVISQHVRQSHQRAAERRQATQPRREEKERRW